MFDLLTKIADLLLKASSSYSDKRDRRRKREFGSELITCYLRLLEVIYTGHAIIKHFQFFQRRFSKHETENDNWTYWRNDLAKDLDKQSLNLTRLGHAIQGVSKVLYVFDPDLAIRLATHVCGKFNAVSELASLLRSGEYPVGFILLNEPTDEDIKSIWSAIQNTGGFSARGRQLQMVASELSDRNENKIDVDVISTAPEWGSEIYERLQKHLSFDVPERQIQKLEECATEIRKLLLNNFELKDLLWSVNKFEDETNYLF